MSNATSAASVDEGDIETTGAPLAVPAETDGGMRAWAQAPSSIALELRVSR